MVIKKEIAWVVVADGAHALIYEQESPQQLKLLQEFSSPESHKLTREIVSDRPGRSYESYGMARHAIAAKSDPQAFEKEKFVRSVASHLNAAALEGKFGALTLCAPPRVLGEFRQFLDKHAEKLVKVEIGKDLMKIPAEELPQHLKTPAKE